MKKYPNWKFPRWGGYLSNRDPVRIRLCDHDGCAERGDRPAPKSKFSDDKWWFCQSHAAEYNRNWNFFTGMNEAEREEAASDDERIRRGYHNTANPWGWASTNESPEQRRTREALAVLELDDESSRSDVRRRFRELAKENHPDTNAGSKEAEDRFKKICAAHDYLANKKTG